MFPASRQIWRTVLSPRVAFQTVAASPPISLLAHSRASSYNGTMHYCMESLVKFEGKNTSIRRPRKTHEPRTVRAVATLNPSKLGSSDIHDISNYTTPKFIFNGRGIWCQYLGSPAKGLMGWNTTFPPNTIGYLYYCHDAGAVPAAGELRFRLTSSSHADGEDLCLPSGKIWGFDLYLLAASSKWAPLCQTLVDDGLVSDRLLAKCRESKTNGSGGGPKGTPVWGLNIPFIMQVDALECRMQIRSPGLETRRASLFCLFAESRGPDTHPYEGKILCQFEVSSLPEHLGTRTLVLRILDAKNVVSRVQDYNGYVRKPASGELAVRPGSKGIWSYNVDQLDPPASRRGLAALFSNLT